MYSQRRFLNSNGLNCVSAFSTPEIGEFSFGIHFDDRSVEFDYWGDWQEKLGDSTKFLEYIEILKQTNQELSDFIFHCERSKEITVDR